MSCSGEEAGGMDTGGMDSVMVGLLAWSILGGNRLSDWFGREVDVSDFVTGECCLG